MTERQARPGRPPKSPDRVREYRENARRELAAMQAANLPGRREKHRAAAERWLRMAQAAEGGNPLYK